MSESIFSLYSDEKFERILYYLKERDIITLEALARFNFDELLFVPGVLENLISEAKQLFSLCDTPSLTVEDTSSTAELACEDALLLENAGIGEPDMHDDENEHLLQQVVKAKDALIGEVYFNVPRSAPFIQKCYVDGKSLMSQLTETDFDNAANLKGLGIASVENLRRIYIEFINSPSTSIRYSEIDKSLYPTDSISCLPLSVRAKNCLKKAGISSFEELLCLTAEDLMDIRNMGIKTCQEILAFRETVAYPEIDPSKLYSIENIASENRPLPIPLLHNIGISEQGFDLFLKNNFFTIGDLCDRGLTPQEYSFARVINSYFSVPVTQHFTEAVDALKDSAKISISKRCAGATLEEIGKELQVTRERVRQILAKTCRKLTGIAELVAGVLLSSDKATFSFSDLINLFRSEESAMYCKLVLQESEYVRYLKFSDSFIKASVCDADIEDRLKEYTDEIIGEGINFYDNLELIESELKKHNLDYFDATDIMNFLVHNRYRFYGDYVTKGTQPYAIVCHDAVRKFFRFDIKLDSDEDNDDMRSLRQIIAKHYHGVPLPPNNRALTAGMTRDPSKLILSGRGRYCPIEKVIYSLSLFEEIHSFISSSSQTSFYYSELFSHFQGRFLAETNIDSPNFLHGMLKCLYPNEFAYERDLMSKVGELRQDIDDRLSQILLENGRSMTKAEIKQSIPGINDFVIAFSVMRLPDVIQWDYNEFNHIDNIKITREEKTILSDAIKTQTGLHNGYASDTLLFNTIKGIGGSFLSRNNITNPQNLYYVASYLFEGDYRFKRPHILSKEFPVQEISTANIAQVLLHCETDLNYEKYTRLATDLGWAGGTVYAIFSELEKDFIRVSENDYVRKNYFGVSQSLISLISDMLLGLVSKSGYFAFSSIFDYESFPKCSYKWNGFLLESLITEYDTGFRIISPQIRDRRYQRGIIVRNESPFKTFEELVLGSLLSDGISTLTETEFLKYLKMRGLIATSAIPQELYECPKMPFKNEVFTVKR
ncbi:MAG: DNA-directed RNA polymerase subunit alpha C-terminal domain-containing protein [Parabacteroides sp.]|nr:DNA-directed RNA polymerase subunit alpha C-terminal domain-containing protein [Parabacteroides sp.]